MNKLHYFLILVFFSVLFSCQDKDKFVLEENMADIEQIITAVIEQDNINILKKNEKSSAIMERFRKLNIIDIKKLNYEKVDKAPPFYFLKQDEIGLQKLYNLREDTGAKIGFDEKDSLYLLSQNKVSDTIRLPESILENSNVLKENELKNWNWQKQYDSYYRFDFPIISKDKTKAYLEVGYICGGLCGIGTNYFLQKQNGKWVVMNKWGTWIK